MLRYIISIIVSYARELIIFPLFFVFFIFFISREYVYCAAIFVFIVFIYFFFDHVISKIRKD